VLLSLLFWLNAAALPRSDGSGRAIGWASVTLTAYGVAVVAGILHLLTRDRRPRSE
jgi:hypothetical protein